VVFISVWPIRDCSLKLFMYLCVYISHFVFTKGFNALWETKTRWDDDFRPWLIKLVKHPHECCFNTIVFCINVYHSQSIRHRFSLDVSLKCSFFQIKRMHNLCIFQNSFNFIGDYLNAFSFIILFKKSNVEIL